MILGAYPIYNSLEVRQLMRVLTEPKMIKGIRVNLIRVGSPAGSVFAQLQTAGGVEMISSDSRTISSLGSGNNWMGLVPFDLEAGLLANTNYFFSLGISGYTYSEAAHLAWAVDWGYDDEGKNPGFYTPYGVDDAPLDIEIWEKKLITKGTYP